MTVFRRIPHLIINRPTEEPTSHWSYDPQGMGFIQKEGRRPAGYVRASGNRPTPNDPGVFVPIPLVNKIRDRVKAWRSNQDHPYLGATQATRRLLEHWRDEQARPHPFFFCQLEAIETLIWLTEGPEDQVRVILGELNGDGGPFRRWCSKMATGSGKTTLMAMIVAWQSINRTRSPKDARFSRDVLVVAPNLTVRDRLQVLEKGHRQNAYQAFGVVPSDLDKDFSPRIRIINWHKLAWESDEKIQKKKGVDKRGAKSDEAYAQEALDSLKDARNLLVINDEAHHAWRVQPGAILGSKEDRDEATVWVGGLDRIHQARGILQCFDLSATPFVPSGKTNAEDLLFPWIVSDFGLNDAIEAGLVKTPRVVVGDDSLPDATTYVSRLYHIYDNDEVRDNLNSKGAQPHDPLPDLVVQAYNLLGADWAKTLKDWRDKKAPTPPVMITVANRTETAARVKYALDHGRISVPELKAPDKTLHIDSKMLDLAESQGALAQPEPDEDGETRKLTKLEAALLLRKMVETVGQEGQPGANIQSVVSVAMLTEGWDARTVTHIMGLRAFSSQLLCEQVVGRGLRRASYDDFDENGLYRAEYVNVFGIPFSFLPQEGGEDGGDPPPPPPHKFRVAPLAERTQSFELAWPNVIRVDRTWKNRLSLDLSKVPELVLRASETLTVANLAPVIGGKADLTRVAQMDLEELARKKRMQTIVFETAMQVFEGMASGWKGSKPMLVAQLVGVVEQFLGSHLIRTEPAAWDRDPLRRKIMLTQNMAKVIQHLRTHISQENAEEVSLVFDESQPVRSTGMMLPWYTSKPVGITKRSHINLCVYDSTWELSEAHYLDEDPHVVSWAKNDHLGFEILYAFDGIVRRYRPDFLVRLTNGKMLVLEVKGEITPAAEAKREALAEWVRAVNQHGGFGTWCQGMSTFASQVIDVLAEHER